MVLIAFRLVVRVFEGGFDAWKGNLSLFTCRFQDLFLCAFGPTSVGAFVSEFNEFREQLSFVPALVRTTFKLDF